MLFKFWEGLGSGLAENWNKKIFTPALLFWGSGIALYSLENGWEEISNTLSNISLGQVLIYVIGGLTIVLISDILIDWLSRPVFRFLEGYWCQSLDWVIKPLIARINKVYNQKITLLNSLEKKKRDNSLSYKEEKEIICLEQWFTDFPTKPQLRMPTKLGNIIRAAEEYPDNRYGLEITTVFPRFWLILSPDIKKELSQSLKELFDLVKVIEWLLLGCIWVHLSPWVIIPIVIGLLILKSRLLFLARSYGEILRSSFDLYRFDLYRSLYWPLPKRPVEEETLGRELTRFLLTGLSNVDINFSMGKKDDD